MKTVKVKKKVYKWSSKYKLFIILNQREIYISYKNYRKANTLNWKKSFKLRKYEPILKGTMNRQNTEEQIQPYYS